MKKIGWVFGLITLFFSNKLIKFWKLYHPISILLTMILSKWMLKKIVGKIGKSLFLIESDRKEKC